LAHNQAVAAESHGDAAELRANPEIQEKYCAV
jgi:hypothetical protein